MKSPMPDGRPTTAGEPPTGVLRRAALILDVFATRARTPRGGLTLTQIASATGLPQASVHRALEQLVTLGWLRRDGMEYRLGMRLAELGAAAVGDDELRLAALPSLRWLHQMTGCVIHLGVLDGDAVEYLERIGGEDVPEIRSRAGSRHPARRTAIGTALLALESRGPSDDPEIDRIRESRLASRRDGCLPGYACLAAPIGPPGHGRAAAVSVFGVADRVESDRQIRHCLQSAAAAIWQRLNAPAATRRSGCSPARARA